MLTKSYDYLFVVLFSILHELGHLSTLYLFGGRADKLSLAYYGIGLKHSTKLTAFKESIFLLSGIFVNLIFFLFDVQKQINLVLIFVNSLPIYPLDMGRVLKLLLNSVFCLRVSDAVFKMISVTILILLIILAIYIKSLSLTLIVIYVIIYSLNYSIDWGYYDKKRSWKNTPICSKTC